MPPGYLDPTRLTFLPVALRDQIAWHQQEEVEAGRTRHERGLPCIWLDVERRRCTQYAFRPERCRDVAIGGTSCVFWRLRRPPLPHPPQGPPARRRRRPAKKCGRRARP